MRNPIRILVMLAVVSFVACESQPYEPAEDAETAFAKGGKLGKPGGGGEDPPTVDPEIVYVGKGGGAFGITGMAADGSGKSLISKCRDSCWRPSWSPDGEKIAFDMLYKKSINIWVVNNDGSGLTQLTDFDGYLNTATRADWSPDGSRIAFTKRIGDRHMIHFIDADGTNLTHIEPPFGFSEGSPTWSPDGTRIAFTRWDETIPHAPDAIFLMAVDGSNVQEVTPPSPMLANGYPEYTDSNPAWSPDGSLIAFDRLIELEDTYRIHVVNPDGTDLTNLTPGLDHWATDPSWSPDGTQIVFDGGNWGIYTMNADGSNVTIIDPTDTSAAYPDWRP